jgi:predicted DsbA family dithiol-disulfide isomerase
MTERLAIDVWSDVMCPFCYLGDAHLNRALEKFPHGDAVDVTYHSFQLMPELEVGTAVDLLDLLVTKRGFPRAQAEAANARLTAQGREFGLDFRFDRAVTTNTLDAHRLTHFAKAAGRQRELVERLFRAYFTDGRNVGSHDDLADLAAEAGLDRAGAAEALASGAFQAEVAADIDQARQYGISGVPFFVFGQKYAVSGAQPVEAFVQALQTAWDDARSATAGR